MTHLKYEWTGTTPKHIEKGKTAMFFSPSKKYGDLETLEHFEFCDYKELNIVDFLKMAIINKD